jgi:hypothetical protein
MHAENMDRFKLESFLKSFRNDSLVFNQDWEALERKEIERI